jgi:hypothetical protein
MRNRIKQEELKKDLRHAVLGIDKELSKFAPELRHAILNEKGEVVPCDLMTWARWLEENRAHRVIVQEDLPHGYKISTVFLGLNHSYFRGPPLWFETMVFEPSDGKPSPITGKIHKLGNEAFCDRYTTLEEARSGHEIIKAKWLGHFSQMAKKEEDARNRNPVRGVRRPSQSEPEAD